MKWMLGLLLAGLAAGAADDPLWLKFGDGRDVQYRSTPTAVGSELEVGVILLEHQTWIRDDGAEVVTLYQQTRYRLNCEWGFVRPGDTKKVEPGSERLKPLAWNGSDQAFIPRPGFDQDRLLTEVCADPPAPKGMTLAQAEAAALKRLGPQPKPPKVDSLTPPPRLIPRPPVEVVDIPAARFPVQAGEQWTLIAINEGNNGLMFLDTGGEKPTGAKVKARLFVAVHTKDARPGAALREVEFDCSGSRVRWIGHSVWTGWDAEPDIGKGRDWAAVIPRSATGRALKAACEGGAKGRAFGGLAEAYRFVGEVGTAVQRRYPARVRSSFLDSCKEGGGSEPVCGCALRSIEREMTLAEFGQLDAAFKAQGDTPLLTRVKTLHAACMADPNLL